MNMLNVHHSDICVLDVSLPEDESGNRNAAEVIRSFHPNMPLILVCTNCNEEAYLQFRHLAPSSFLGMEISRFTLLQAIDLAILQIGSIIKYVPALPQQQGSDFLRPCFFRNGDTYQAFPVQDVQYFYASEKLIYAKLARQVYPINSHLKILEKVLHDNFIRIHKTYLVNVHHIEAIHTSENIVMIDGQKLPIGSSYRKSFLKRVPLL